jgi:hypothetical protein
VLGDGARLVGRRVPGRPEIKLKVVPSNSKARPTPFTPYIRLRLAVPKKFLVMN